MADDPFSIFDAWMKEAEAAEPNDANAMALATADRDGRPSVRMVLLKAFDEHGFVFHTNFESRKGADLAANPHAALLLHWKSLRRQVRIEGKVARAGDDVSDAYFATRPRERQIGAWASEQSQPLVDSAAFEARYEEFRKRFEGGEVPRPANWGGFLLVPERIEFWTDRAHRLHERRLFERAGQGWREGLLYP